MGVKISPDVAQYIMEDMLQDLLQHCNVYMDDVGIWTHDTYDYHLQIVDAVLQRFADNNMKCNPLKCCWAVQETDFLGYWMTPTCIKPWKNSD
jgi:hypothetical protein